MFFLYLNDEAKTLDLLAVLLAGGHDIDSGSVDTAVAQNIGQLSNVLFDSVKSPGEQLSQIVGKDLAALDPGFIAKPFHGRPDGTPVQRFACSV